LQGTGVRLARSAGGHKLLGAGQNGQGASGGQMQPCSPGGAPASIFAGGAIAVRGSPLHACTTASTKAVQPSTASGGDVCVVMMTFPLRGHSGRGFGGAAGIGRRVSAAAQTRQSTMVVARPSALPIRTFRVGYAGPAATIEANVPAT
jgi:hypothetical protein